MKTKSASGGREGSARVLPALLFRLKTISSLIFFALLLFAWTAFAKERSCCWVDIKTGKKVPSVPDSGINHVGDLQDLLGADKIHDPGIAIVSIDGKTARNTRTGKQYAKEPDGCWVDIKTGKRVPSVPDSGINHVSDLQDLKGAGKIHDPGIARIDIDGKTARNSRTGKQYALEDCSPPATTQRPSVTPTPSTTDKVTDVLKTIGSSISIGVGGGTTGGRDHHDRVKGEDRTRTAEKLKTTDKSHTTSKSKTTSGKTVTAGCKCHPCTCSPCRCH